MLLLIDDILSLISPHICKGCHLVGSTYCPRCVFNTLEHYRPICLYCGCSCKSNNLCPKCKNKHKLFTDLISIGPRQGGLRHLVGDYKYHSEIASCRPLSQLVALKLTKIDVNDDMVIVPIPTVEKHIRERGFDHTLLLAKEISKLTHIKVNNKILIRLDNSSQHSLSASQRKNNISHSLGLTKRYIKKDSQSGHERYKSLEASPTIILLDDIWTTGSTMEQAARLLKSLGSKRIIGVTICYQPKQQSC